MSSQSFLKKASPPIIVISLVPRRLRLSITPKHCSVVNSPGLTFPALDPQCEHFKLHAKVISHTTCTGVAVS